MAEFITFYDAGNVPEDVINALYDISPLDRPVTGRISHISAASARKEWLDHVLRAPKADNAIIDGSAAVADDTSQGTRYWQSMQLAEAGIVLGDQASESDGFGNITKFETQLEKRVNELYRDTEANAMSILPSVIPVEATTAGQAAGVYSQIVSNASVPGDGAVGGWNSGTGVFDAPTLGTARALSEDDILNVMESASTNGARPDVMTMRPALKRRFSTYMMSSSSRVGVLVTQAPGGDGGATAVGSVQVYETDFGVLEVMNNQIAQVHAANTSGVFIMQTDMINAADQWTPRAKRLGSVGAGERWQVTNSCGTLLLTERAHGMVLSVLENTDMVP